MSRARDLADYVSTGVTSAELDKLDGLTATTDELNLVDGSVSGPLSHRNLIINGAMQVWQRGTDITCLNNSLEGYNSADRYTFLFNSSCPGTLDVDRSTDTPDGFGYSMKLKCNATATPVASSADYIWVSNRIEAQDLQHLNYGSSSAKEMTLSWYMKSVNYTSPISIYIEKPDGTVSYFVKSFTPTTSWDRYTMTVPANTNSGHTIANDNGLGLSVNIVLAGSDGGNYEQTGDSTAWGTTQKYYTDTQGNFFTSTSNELYITGLQLELGSVATPFEHRGYADELRRCQRYYHTILTLAASSGVLSYIMSGQATVRGAFQLATTMRAAGTLVESHSDIVYRFNGTTSLNNDSTIPTIDLMGDYGGTINFQGFSNLPTAGYAGIIRITSGTSSAHLALLAEL